MLPPWVKTLRSLVGTWGSARALSRELGLNRCTLSNLVRGRQQAVCARTDAVGERVQALSARVAPAAPAGAYERIWTSMRVLRRFLLVDLMVTASTTRNLSKRMVSYLLRGGYLRIAGQVPRSRTLVYALVRDTGPRPPLLRKHRGSFFDPNTGQEVLCDGGN